MLQLEISFTLLLLIFKYAFVILSTFISRPRFPVSAFSNVGNTLFKENMFEPYQELSLRTIPRMQDKKTQGELLFRQGKRGLYLECSVHTTVSVHVIYQSNTTYCEMM